MPPAFIFPGYHPAVLLLLMRLAFQYAVNPGLAAGDVQVFVISEMLFLHQSVAAVCPGGLVYLVVRRHAVDHRPAQP
ncbi:hypothetical protein CIT292_10975 [Citrobacter youngae ATCC 29220]|uniref:Uncharacterized protein n=1 Tax=Citrobacter youngae ATCC 29220 TaxID=500640 RepID=D4BJY1_9ENTR|nr:hypothetical protein CIT292_10975 [Citrobacter youngae ATCC 29220]